jgi:hypothetical protein
MNIVAARHMTSCDVNRQEPGGFTRYEMCTDRVVDEVEQYLF